MINLADEFPHAKGAYLNHAAVAPWAKRTRDAVIAFAQENYEQGATGYPRWMEVEQRLRERFVRLINAPSSDDIALLKNTSEALSVVAYGIDWQPGDTIVVALQEFPSNRIVWQSLEKQGVKIHLADLNSSESPEDALLDLVDNTTRLLAVSSVQFANGLRMDLHKLGNFCNKNNILFCVDAIQSIGALEMDVQAIHADFIMADSHKWMMGPEGVAVFYCTPDQRKRLKLNQYGWHMVADPFDFDKIDWRPADSARRFECGSPNMLCIHAMDASLSLFEEISMGTVETMLFKKTSYLIDLINESSEIQLLSDTRPERRSGIVTFTCPGCDLDSLYQHLMHHGVICAQRGGGIRFSPHFYTEYECIETAMKQVAGFISR